MNVRQRISCSLFLSASMLCMGGGASAQPQSGSAVPTVETILTRMAQARAENRARLRPYKLTRDYKLFGLERQTTKSEVTADITFVPPDLKQYAIQRANGAGLGEKIVRLMLDSETDIAKNYGSTDMTLANYNFSFLREEEMTGQRCYVLEMRPRRKDKILLRGQIWVDSTTYLLRRTEGEPGKPPSWWLRDARIVLIYGDVSGMWLQTGSESTANVRFLGQHTMVARDVDYKVSELDAYVRAQ
ncbi:MAG: hypothetical protein JWO19_1925 [Bryobacterales bacterium]|nr:hypothetical protein [Bryobacterales bacterium]